MKSKLLMVTLLATFSQLSIAGVDANSFTGAFKTGTCDFSKAETATVNFDGNTLKLTFAGDKNPKQEILVQSVQLEDGFVEVNTDSFSITNIFISDVVGSPVSKARIARSATGNRVRFSTVNFERNAQSECVLYRQ